MRTVRPRARRRPCFVPRAAPPPDLVVARRRLAPLQGRRDRRGALARPARRHAGRRQPDDVGEGQGELREPAHRPQRRHLDLLGVADGAARRCRSGWSRAVPSAPCSPIPSTSFRRASSTGAKATSCWRGSRGRSTTSRRRSSGASRRAPRPTARRRLNCRSGESPDDRASGRADQAVRASSAARATRATTTTNSPGMR